MKRIISLLLAVSMVLSMFVTVFAATTYPDLVGDNAVYAAAVDALTELKVVNGFPDGQFKPGDELTRAELAKMLVVCLGLGEQVDALATRTVFSDVPATHWAAGYINAAAQSKVIIGYPDGTFKPEQNVSYAEAFTMALRALGYGNVVEAEGTWPTAYMLKAVELELTDDLVGEIKPAAASLRGNTAILLWNMLRTPMWRITEESEKNGMTLSDFNQRIMLNVKFPNYMYLEDVYLTSIDITDKDDATATVTDKKAFTANLDGVNLLDLVVGMKVTTLVKDWKDEDKATFLTLTPANTVVRGFVTDMKVDKNGNTTFKVDDTEYRFSAEPAAPILEPGDYIAFEADGKKVNTRAGEYVCRFYPTDGTYAKTQSALENDIEDDDLVIVDGEWGSVEDVALGSVYTQVFFNTGFAWFVNGQSEKATFDVMFDDKEDWDGGKVEVTYLTLDDNDTRIAPNFEAYEKENNTQKIGSPYTKLKVKIKDNDYSDNEVEVFYNYLDIPVRMHFGEINKNKNAGFYAVVSNGAANSTSLKGKTYTMELVNQDGGDAVEYTSVAGADMPGEITDNETVYKREQATYVWAKFADDGETIEEVVVLADGLKSGDKVEGATYKSKYEIAEVNKGAKLTDKKIATSAGELTVQKSAFFFESTAVKNEKDKIEGFEVTVSRDRTEYDDTVLPDGTLVAYDPENDNKVKYVFLVGESESKLQWGRVGEINYGKETVSLDTTSASELGSESIPGAGKKDLVSYTLDKKEEKATIKKIFDVSNIDDAQIVDGNADYDEEDDDYIPTTDKKNFTLDPDDKEYKDHKKYNVYVVTLKGKVNENFEISGVEKAEGKGHSGVAAKATAWDRILVVDDDKTIFVFTGIFDEDTTTKDGELLKGEATDEPIEENPSDPAPVEDEESDKNEVVESDKNETVESDKNETVESDKNETVESDKNETAESDKTNNEDSDRI